MKVTTVLREKVGGPAADLIVREAKRQRADLIVLGSDAEQVVRTAFVPVLLVRA